jgi:hypothetical protein
VLHPVGQLPASVYWRRRLLLLGGILVVLAGLGWLIVALVGGSSRGGQAEAAETRSAARSVAPPSLEQVVPSLASVRVPTVPPKTRAPKSTSPKTEDAAAESAPAEQPEPADGGPCTDDMISVVVRPERDSVPAGSKPTLELVVTNTSPVSCVRQLDKALQEIVLLDAAGERVWGSNDCFPESGSDERTLAAGEAVVFPVVWGGRTSEPGCAGPRDRPEPGGYVLRGRLDAKLSADAPLALT